MPKQLTIPCLVAALAAISGCGTTTITTRVLRAPLIRPAAKGDTVSVREAAFRCVERRTGPDTVWREVDAPLMGSMGVRTRKKVLAERTSNCDRVAMAHKLRAHWGQQLLRQVAQSGYRLHGAPVAGEITYAFDIAKSVTVAYRGVLEDSKGSTRCMEQCSSSTCHRIDVGAVLEVNATFDGPLAGGLSQRVTRTYRFGAIPGFWSGTAQVLVCHPGAAEQYHDWDRIDWAHAARAAHDGLSSTFRELIQAHKETLEVGLYDDVSGSPLNDEAIRLARLGQWKAALRAFRAALKDFEATVPNRPAKAVPRARAKLLYNRAAGEMMVGNITTAQELARRSLTEERTSLVDALIEELKRREHDRLRAPELYPEEMGTRTSSP